MVACCIFMRMKTFFCIVLAYLLGLHEPAFSQSVKLGIKLSPTIIFNRFVSHSDSIAINNTQNDKRFTFGLTADFGLTDNYFFSTGVLYSLRKVTFAAVNLNSGESDTEQYSLEYIELPLTLKLYTNDIGVDSKIYFQPGFTLDFLVNWKGINKNDNRVNGFYFFDSSFYIGAGLEKMLGVTTAFFAGLFYQRGLVDIANKNDDITLKNDLLGLDLGLRF